MGRLVERLVVNQYNFFSWLIKNILLFWIILYCCSGLFFYFLILWEKEEIRMEGDSWADFGSAAANSEVSGFSLSQGAFLSDENSEKGSLIQDQLDHGASKEPKNSSLEWIHWFL